MLSVLLCMEQDDLFQREALSTYDQWRPPHAHSAYDQWRLMQGERAISPHVRAYHAIEPRRTSQQYLQDQRHKRFEEFEAIKRLRRLSWLVNLQQATRKREKATKKTLARNAQNAVRRRDQITNILSYERSQTHQ